jgi:hypothetical protein
VIHHARFRYSAAGQDLIAEATASQVVGDLAAIGAQAGEPAGAQARASGEDGSTLPR